MKRVVNWKSIVRWGLLAFGIAIFAFLVRQISFDQLVSSLARTKLDFFVLGILLTLSATLIRTVRFGFFFQPHGRWMQLYAVFLTTRMLNIAMPMKSGEIAFVVLLRKFKFVPSVAEVTPVWLLLRTTDAAALVLLIAIASVLFPTDLGMGPAGWLIAGLSTAAFAGLITLSRWSDRIPMVDRLPHLASQIRRFQTGLIHTRGTAAWIRSLLLAVLTSITLILSLTSFQLAFNVPFSPAVAFTIGVGVFTISALPIHPPLGIGTIDAVWTGALMLMGLEIEAAVAVTIGIRMMDILVPATEGVVGSGMLQLAGRQEDFADQAVHQQSRNL